MREAGVQAVLSREAKRRSPGASPRRAVPGHLSKTSKLASTGQIDSKYE